ncbi:MAG TPA: type II toxin-antitoxin system VapC family toxin [Gammaproteobacteria bacterium]|nr:type II toxin-antitoxin system VapC family toxin [Gammaproteobacteria bacterium]
MTFVLDSSVAMSWLLPDETHAAADVIADRLLEQKAVVPTIWPIEVCNVLLVAQRRKRITLPDAQNLLKGLRQLPIEVEKQGADDYQENVMAVAAKYSLSSYDASYLELAIRLDAPLATLDKKLAVACLKAKVSTLI